MNIQTPVQAFLNVEHVILSGIAVVLVTGIVILFFRALNEATKPDDTDDHN